MRSQAPMSGGHYGGLPSVRPLSATAGSRARPSATASVRPLEEVSRDIHKFSMPNRKGPTTGSLVLLIFPSFFLAVTDPDERRRLRRLRRPSLRAAAQHHGQLPSEPRSRGLFWAFGRGEPPFALLSRSSRRIEILLPFFFFSPQSFHFRFHRFTSFRCEL